MATTKTTTTVRYYLRETFPNSPTVLSSGDFSDYDTAVETIAEWKLVPGSIREIVKATMTTVVTTEEETFPL